MKLNRAVSLQSLAYLVCWIFSITLTCLLARYSGFFHEPALFLSKLIGTLSQQGVFHTVWEVQSLDHMGYLGRETPYLLFFGDALFVRLCALGGVPHFYSLTHFLALLAITAAHGVFSQKYLKSSPFLVNILLLALFLTTPMVVLSAGFCLPGQSVTTLFIILSLWVFAIIASNQENTRWAALSVFAVSAPLPFLGPQGWFFLAAMIGMVSLSIVLGNRSSWLLAAWLAMALGGNLFIAHKFLIGPWIAQSLDAAFPRSQFGNFAVWEFIRQLPFFLIQGFQTLVGNVSLFFGGYGLWGAGLATAVFFVPWFVGSRPGSEIFVQDRPFPARTGMVMIMAAGVLLLTFMNALILFHRSDILVFKHLRVVRYWLPACGCLLVGASLSINRLLQIFPSARTLVIVVLAAMALSNVYAIHSQKQEFLIKSAPSLTDRAQEAVKCLQFPDKPIFCFNLDQSDKIGISSKINKIMDYNADGPPRDLQPIYRACRMLRAPVNYESGNLAEWERILAVNRHFLTMEPFGPHSPELTTELLVKANRYRPHVIIFPPVKTNGPIKKETSHIISIPLLRNIFNALPLSNSLPPDTCSGWDMLILNPETKTTNMLMFLFASNENLSRLTGAWEANGISYTDKGKDPFFKQSMDRYSENGDLNGLAELVTLEVYQAISQCGLGRLDTVQTGLREFGSESYAQKNYSNAALAYEIASAIGAPDDLSTAGAIYHKLGFPQKAHTLLLASLRNAPDSIVAQNNLAWFLATTPDPKFANGEEAESIAISLMKNSPPNYSVLDTLAAAQARMGKFDQALETARLCQEIIRKQSDDAFLPEIASRIQLYRNGVPFLEGRHL